MILPRTEILLDRRPLLDSEIVILAPGLVKLRNRCCHLPQEELFNVIHCNSRKGCCPRIGMVDGDAPFTECKHGGR